MDLQRGRLVLADIGGYSRYLAGVELEHSYDILADLLSTIVRQLRGPLELAKLEGDAVFCYDVDKEGPGDGLRMVALLEACYFAFQRRVRTISHLTTCTCDACFRIPNLGLKFAVHYGDFILHDVMGQRELVGRDVVLAHRLLKNTVTERTGLGGYALYSRAWMDRHRLEPAPLGMTEHRERYEDVGDVECCLHDLEASWREEQERAAVYLGPGEALVEVVRDVRGEAATVWDYVTAPSKRPQWQPGLIRLEQEDPGGVTTIGSISHCVHGDFTVREEVVDWKPFDYFTLDWNGPYGRLLGTFELAPLGEGSTRLTFRMEPVGDKKARAALIADAEQLKEGYRYGFDRLAALVESAEPDAGRGAPAG